MPVEAVTESQVVDAAGQLSDVYEITFTVPNKAGSFTVQVPKQGDPVSAAREAIAAVEAEVNGIYGL